MTDAPVIVNDSPVTLKDVERIVTERDQQLKADLEAMLNAKFAEIDRALQNRATHDEVDERIEKAIAPLETKVDRVLNLIEGSLGNRVNAIDGTINSLANRISGIEGAVSALSSIKGTEMEMIRDRQRETDRQVDLLQVSLSGVSADVRTLYEDIRGAPTGDGPISLFRMIGELATKIDENTHTSLTAIRQVAFDLDAVKRQTEADHAFVERIRSLSARSAKAAVDGGWKWFVERPLKVKMIGMLGGLVVGLLVSSGSQTWIIQLIEELLK